MATHKTLNLIGKSRKYVSGVGKEYGVDSREYFNAISGEIQSCERERQELACKGERADVDEMRSYITLLKELQQGALKKKRTGTGIEERLARKSRQLQDIIMNCSDGSGEVKSALERAFREVSRMGKGTPAEEDAKQEFRDGWQKYYGTYYGKRYHPRVRKG